MTKLFFAVLFSFVLYLSDIRAQVIPDLYSNVDQKSMMHWVDSVYNDLSDDERIGQLFMASAYPATDNENITKLLRLVQKSKIGGIMFLRGDPDKQVRLTNRLQQAAHVPLFIAIDGEWGLAMRLNNTTRFPKNMMAGAVSDSKLIELYGKEVGRQCREMGIHINFAPVMDINSNVNNPVIGIRSFGEKRTEVARKAIEYARGLESEGIISVAKHFPGHGDTNEDSHLSLPTLNHTLKRLQEVELYPFEKYIKSGLSGIMVAHLNIPALKTDGKPGSLSYSVVTDLLRNKEGFRGLCFTDGLAMKGVLTDSNESVCVQALQAGNDVLVGPIDTEKEVNAVKQAVRNKALKMSDIETRCRKILCYKYIVGLNHYSAASTDALLNRLNSPFANYLNEKLNEEAITIVKNDNDLIPLKRLDKIRIAALSIGKEKGNVFHETLSKYAKVDFFTLSEKTETTTKKTVFEKLSKYDVIICSVHNLKSTDNDYLLQLAKEKEMIFVFFTVPYKCVDYKSTLLYSKSIVVAYEDTNLSENFAAQALFGGIAVKGVLPVSIPSMFDAGTCIETQKTRLGYHAPEEVNIDSYKLKAIDSVIRDGLEKEAYPGCRALIVKNGIVFYDKSFGYYDFEKKEKVTWNTVYDLASLSKVTGTLLGVMKVFEEGYVKLNDRIAGFIPELKNSDKKNILIKDLLYHQSGLPAVINFFEQAVDKNSYSGSLYSRKKDATHQVSYDSRTYMNNTFTYNPKDVSEKKKQGFTKEIAQNLYVSDTFVADSILSGIIRSKMGVPGKYTYSCINFILLKIMIERITGKTLDAFVEDNFMHGIGAYSTTYNPLKKMNISLIAPSEIDKFVRRQTIRGYVHDEAAAFQGGVSGNAGLFSNAEDLAKIAQLFLNNGNYGGERYLSAETCSFFTTSKSSSNRRALGFDKPDKKQPDRSPCSKLAPASVYGHTGFTGTCLWIDPDNDLIFIFLSNRTMPSRANSKLFSLGIRTKIQDIIYKSLK